MSNILEIENLNIILSKRHGPDETLVNQVSFNIPKGKITGVVGESGSGKSLSMKSLLGILPDNLIPACKSYRFNGMDLDIHQGKKLTKLPISMIFQDPLSSLNPVQTIGYHLLEVIERYHNKSGASAKKIAAERLRDVEIPNAEHVLKLYPHELSGGMIQRVMIAMALLKKPELLIADEPTTALDVTVQAQVLSLLRKLKADEDLSVILVTHDFGVIAEMCDYIYVMYDGLVVEAGPVEKIFYQPQHQYTRELLKSIPNSKRREKLHVMEKFILSDDLKHSHIMEEVGTDHFVVKEQ